MPGPIPVIKDPHALVEESSKILDEGVDSEKGSGTKSPSEKKQKKDDDKKNSNSNNNKNNK